MFCTRIRSIMNILSRIQLSAVVSGKAAVSLLFLLVAPLLLAQDAVKAAPRNASTFEATITTNHGSDAVLDWNNTALTAIETLDLVPPIAGYCMAMAHAAIFVAVNTIIGVYEPYVAKVSSPPRAS